jgi:hypothetical protein
MSKIKQMAMLFVLAVLFANLYEYAPIGAQDNAQTWSVWLNNTVDGELVRVYVDGTVERITHPSQEEYPARPAFSTYGNLLAYCEWDETGQAFSLHIYDAQAKQKLFNKEIGQVTACNVGGDQIRSGQAFSPDSLMIAYTISHYDETDIRNDKAAWEIVLLDIASGDPAFSLTPQSPGFAALNGQYPAHFMPHVRHFTDEQVHFVMLPAAGDFAAKPDAYVWNFRSGEVNWAQPYSDMLCGTGEVIWPGIDNTEPINEDPPPMAPPWNAIRYAPKMLSEPRTLHPEPEIPDAAVFINDGWYIAIHILGEYDEEIYSTRESWIIMDRQGTASQTTGDLTGYNLVSAPSGYAFLQVQNEGYDVNQTRIIYRKMDALAYEETILWENAENVWWNVLWAGPCTVADDLPPFN